MISVASPGHGKLVVRYRHSGMGCMLLFLGVFLTGWTAAGAAAIWVLVTKFRPFAAIWLCGWLLGEVFVAGTLL